MHIAYRTLVVALCLLANSLFAQTYAVYIGIDSAFAGDIIRIPVVVPDVAALQAQGGTLVGVNVSYNTTVLEPLDDPHTNNDVAGRVAFSLVLTPGMDSVLGTLPFRAALGNSATSVLRIESASTNAPGAQLVPTNGLFSLRGVCYEGGPRLMNPSGSPSITIPNPLASSASLPIELTLIEQGRTKLWITDMLGRTTKVFINDLVEPGKRKLALDLTSIATGKYLLILQTPTQQITRTIEVAR